MHYLHVYFCDYKRSSQSFPKYSRAQDGAERAAHPPQIRRPCLCETETEPHVPLHPARLPGVLTDRPGENLT